MLQVLKDSGKKLGWW